MGLAGQVITMRKALERIAKKPRPSDMPSLDWETVDKYRRIARSALKKARAKKLA